MRTNMRPIKSVNPVPIAQIAAAYYCVIALLLGPVYALTDFKAVYAPLGFLIPLLSLKFDFTIQKPQTPLGLFFVVLVSAALYAATGWLSGFICAVAYNFTSKHFHIRIDGDVESQEVSDPPKGITDLPGIRY